MLLKHNGQTGPGKIVFEKEKNRQLAPSRHEIQQGWEGDATFFDSVTFREDLEASGALCIFLHLCLCDNSIPVLSS